MKALDFFQSRIRFDKSSPISGDFDLRKYRMLQRPIEALDNPAIKCETIFKASGCMGTVFLQMVLVHDICRRLGDGQVVAQTDDDASEWTKTRGKPFIIPLVQNLVSNEKHAITNDLWLFTHKFIVITGPGASAQQSKQVHQLRTDESHLFNKGVLTAFRARMGGKWNRHEMHFTTAPDKGHEADTIYMDGTQCEFHYRCGKCAQLVWPLWEDYSRDYYNGERVFIWTEHQSDRMTDESLRFICPHCQTEYKDDDRDRFDLQTDGDYVSMNPDAPKELVSFRWSCFGAFWMKWVERLHEWKAALYAERLGDLSKMEEFEKKRLCMSYVVKLHDLGTGGIGSRNYSLGAQWEVEDKRRFCSIDIQEKGGRHYWGLVDEFDRNGNSRRVFYKKLFNWDEVKSFAEMHEVKYHNCCMDLGHAFMEAVSKCSEWQWTGFQSTDGDIFMIPDGKGGMLPNRFYGPNSVYDAYIGKEIPTDIQRARIRVAVSGRIKLPSGDFANVVGPGFAITVQWSKQNIGFVLLALKGGTSGRYYGIARDMPDEFGKQLHTYVQAPKITTDSKVVGFTSKLLLRQISEDDHAFACASMNLLMAMRAGYFPMDITAEKVNAGTNAA